MKNYRFYQEILKNHSYLLFSILLVILSFQDINAQAREGGFESMQPPRKERKSGFDASRLRFGGSFGATFGDRTYVDISPTVGYMITDNFIAGLSGRYIYFQDNIYGYKTNIYGGGAFTEYFILQNITLHAEYELLNMDNFLYPNESKRININSVLVGGGYRMMVGNSSFASILILYNLIDNEHSIYTNPIIRINFGIGF